MSIVNRLNKLIMPATSRFSKSTSLLAHNLAEAVESEKQELFLDSENCILVDDNDKNIGFASKRDCHKVDHNGIRLHRAFSVFLFNRDGDMLLQKRSSHKVRLSLYSWGWVEIWNLHKTTCPPLDNVCAACWPSTNLFFSTRRLHFPIATQTLAARIHSTTSRTRRRRRMRSESNELHSDDSTMNWEFHLIRWVAKWNVKFQSSISRSAERDDDEEWNVVCGARKKNFQNFFFSPRLLECKIRPQTTWSNNAEKCRKSESCCSKLRKGSAVCDVKTSRTEKLNVLIELSHLSLESGAARKLPLFDTNSLHRQRRWSMGRARDRLHSVPSKGRWREAESRRSERGAMD